MYMYVCMSLYGNLIYGGGCTFMKSWEREFEWHRPTCSPSLELCAAKATTPNSNQAHSQSQDFHTSLASHEQSVNYIVVSNNMSSKLVLFCVFFYIIIIILL